MLTAFVADAAVITTLALVGVLMVPVPPILVVTIAPAARVSANMLL